MGWQLNCHPNKCVGAKKEEVAVTVGTFFHELVRVGIYKRSQGRVTRQITFAAMAAAIALGLLRLSSILMTSTLTESMAAWSAGRPLWLPFFWLASMCAWLAALPGFYLWFPSVLLAAFVWAAYRLVNLPSFADFLIAVEAEMNKVRGLPESSCSAPRSSC